MCEYDVQVILASAGFYGYKRVELKHEGHTGVDGTVWGGFSRLNMWGLIGFCFENIKLHRAHIIFVEAFWSACGSGNRQAYTQHLHHTTMPSRAGVH